MNIPIAKPFLDREEEEAAVEAIRSGWVSQGPKVQEFEDLFSRYVGAKYAVATTSCTTALHAALAVSGVGPGDPWSWTRPGSVRRRAWWCRI